MPEERILTLHPEGKKGVNITKLRYERMKEAILAVLSRQEEVSFQELGDLVADELAGKFDGKILWYVVSVKQDLEARGVIEQIPGRRKQHLRLKS